MNWSNALRRLMFLALYGGIGCLVSVAVVAQQAATSPTGGGGALVSSFFTLLDRNSDGSLSRDEMRTTFENWYARWDAAKSDALTIEQVVFGVSAVFPPAVPGEPPRQNQTPPPQDVAAMLAALPESAPAKPLRPRKVLVLGRCDGFVHASIPLAARTIEEIGKKTGAWSTTISYDPADVNAANLKQYDAIVLASTTGAFLDDPSDKAETAARRTALLEFVRGGKGLVGIHAATDAYHRNAAGGGSAAVNFQTLPVAMQLFGGDRNGDGRLSREELVGLAEVWFDRLDTDKGGRVARADFPQRYATLPVAVPRAPATGGRGLRQAPATNLGPDREVGTWPEFNNMIGAIFKAHWNDGLSIPVKNEDPKHPINAAFKGQDYVIVDETYTFSRDTYSRSNVHVLTSIDHAKMSADEKAMEQNPRSDGDYPLSWIRREGKGRVFYEAHGHNAAFYANRMMLQHIIAGMQYVLGDLVVDDSPTASVK